MTDGVVCLRSRLERGSVEAGSKEARVFERTSHTLKVDRATAIFGGIKQLSVQCQYTITTPIEGGGHQSKYRSSWAVYYGRTVKFLLLETVESGNHLAWGASCYLVFTEEVEKVIHTAQATGVRLSNGGHDCAFLHP